MPGTAQKIIYTGFTGPVSHGASVRGTECRPMDSWADSSEVVAGRAAQEHSRAGLLQGADGFVEEGQGAKKNEVSGDYRRGASKANRGPKLYYFN